MEEQMTLLLFLFQLLMKKVIRLLWLMLPLSFLIPFTVTAVIITFPYVIILFSAGFTPSTYDCDLGNFSSVILLYQATGQPSPPHLFPSHCHSTPQISIRCFYYDLLHSSLCRFVTLIPMTFLFWVETLSCYLPSTLSFENKTASSS